MSRSASYIDEDSLSIPAGHLTPPEGTHGGITTSIKHEMPHLQDLNTMPLPDAPTLGHGRLVVSRWDNFIDVLTGRSADLVVDGRSLDLATIVAVAR